QPNEIEDRQPGKPNPAARQTVLPMLAGSPEVIFMPAAPPASIPIGIREIVVENFRGIGSLELKFLDAGESATDIVVLGGPNGSGKTSILEACLLALGHPELIRSP